MSIERVHFCGLYLPGHDVHWIQARLSSEQLSRCPSAPGHLLEVQTDGIVVVEVDGEVRRLWNHDTDRVEQLAARNGGEISHQPGFGLLRTASDRGSYLFCVADAGRRDLRTCPTHPPTGDPLELLREAGGFTISGQEALRWPESAGEK
jgi:hypothetical protein